MKLTQAVKLRLILVDFVVVVGHLDVEEPPPSGFGGDPVSDICVFLSRSSGGLL